jgi:hypothetical protein
VFVFELCPFQPPNIKLQQFADYLVDNYISEDSLFPPEIWAENSAARQMLVNRSVHTGMVHFISAIPHCTFL